VFPHIGNWWHDIICLAAYVVADWARFRRFVNLTLFVGVMAIG
jgi:hypothetical protein